jgi:hypothetical protein
MADDGAVLIGAIQVTALRRALRMLDGADVEIVDAGDGWLNVESRYWESTVSIRPDGEIEPQ